MTYSGIWFIVSILKGLVLDTSLKEAVIIS